MTKLFLGGLSVAAFLYAVYLLLMRKRLPNPKAAHGWRRRFTLATLLCAGFLLSLTGYRAQTMTCYMQPDKTSATSPEKDKRTKPAITYYRTSITGGNQADYSTNCTKSHQYI